MCVINGRCGCNRLAGGIWELLLVGGGKLLLWLLRRIARALQIALVLLIVAGRWAIPRAWRLTVRAYRAGRRRWQMRPVLLPADRPAVTATTTAPTLADLRLTKQEAKTR